MALAGSELILLAKLGRFPASVNNGRPDLPAPDFLFCQMHLTHGISEITQVNPPFDRRTILKHCCMENATQNTLCKCIQFGIRAGIHHDVALKCGIQSAKRPKRNSFPHPISWYTLGMLNHRCGSFLDYRGRKNCQTYHGKS